jgi:hypothetical protein
MSAASWQASNVVSRHEAHQPNELCAPRVRTTAPSRLPCGIGLGVSPVASVPSTLGAFVA